MISFTALHISGLAEEELSRWIGTGLVHAHAHEGGWGFEEIDVARIRLIHTLRHELEVTEPALPVVLSLIDQLYDFRRRAVRLNEALACVPPVLRAEILTRIEQS